MTHRYDEASEIMIMLNHHFVTYTFGRSKRSNKDPIGDNRGY